MGKVKQSEFENIQERRQQFRTLMDEIEIIYSGLYFSFGPIVMSNGNTLDLDKIHKFVDALMDSTRAVSKIKPSEETFYEVFYTTALLYLYAECSSDDHIGRSIQMLGDTMYKSETNSVRFEQTVFGIMIGDTFEPGHQSVLEMAHQAMCEPAKKLKELYEASDKIIGMPETVRAALRHYADIIGASFFCKEETFDRIMLKWKRTKMSELMQLSYSSSSDKV